MTVLIEVWMGMMYFPSKERELGSATFLAWLLVTNAFVDLLYITVAFALSLAWDPRYKFFMMINGMWPLVMLALTLQSLSDPDGSSSFWGMITLPNRWYPVFIVGLFSLMNMRVMWDITCAVAVGYAYRYLPLEWLLPRRSRARALESRCLCGRRSLLGAPWVFAMEATAGATQSSSDRRYAGFLDWGRGGSSATGGGSAPVGFSAFAGAGNRLGESQGGPAIAMSHLVQPLAEHAAEEGPPPQAPEETERATPVPHMDGESAALTPGASV